MMIAVTTTNATLDRLLRHMAWANQEFLSTLAQQPESHLHLHAQGEPEWTVYAITRHFVRSAGIYCHRLGADVTLMDYEISSGPESIAVLAASVKEYDRVLRAEAHKPEAILPHTRPDGTKVTRARSTILGQAIHHATEHRAQVAGILSAHGNCALDLDSLDVWALGDAEGLGE